MKPHDSPWKIALIIAVPIVLFELFLWFAFAKAEEHYDKQQSAITGEREP